MSASPMARQVVESNAIPIRRVIINDHSELPAHYSSTPGGTLFSTTPGGTKIVYERSTLLTLRNSPISKTPPTYTIPENILSNHSNDNHSKTSPLAGFSKKTKKIVKVNVSKNVSEDQFQIEL